MLVVVGMLEIEFPTKLNTYIHGFDFVSLSVPDEYNIALILFPEEDDVKNSTFEQSKKETIKTNKDRIQNVTL